MVGIYDYDGGVVTAPFACGTSDLAVATDGTRFLATGYLNSLSAPGSYETLFEPDGGVVSQGIPIPQLQWAAPALAWSGANYVLLSTDNNWNLYANYYDANGNSLTSTGAIGLFWLTDDLFGPGTATVNVTVAGAQTLVVSGTRFGPPFQGPGLVALPSQPGDAASAPVALFDRDAGVVQLAAVPAVSALAVSTEWDGTSSPPYAVGRWIWLGSATDGGSGDSGSDAQADAGPDAQADAGPDAQAEAGPTAGDDGGDDSGAPIPPSDAGADSTVPTDSGSGGTLDATVGNGSDAGPAGDAAATGSTPAASSGCGCTVAGGPSDGWRSAVALALGALLVTRRRKR
jgi:MYXO-CTERM domain-containing protein